MKNKGLKMIAVAMSGFLFAYLNIAFAQDHSHQHGAPSHETMTNEAQNHEGHDTGSGEPQQPKGKLIAEKKVEGDTLTYYLLNLEERNEMMKGMEGMTMAGMSDSPDVTNHLTVYIKGPDAKLMSGKVGFSITNPDGTNFKTLTMGMYGGYGADVIFKAKGTYQIIMKAVIDDKTITDKIAYEVK